MILAAKTKALIDKHIEQKQGDGFREHLGASLLGKKCARYIWYKWRWAKRMSALARLLRLWDRGNKEEFRFVQWLRQAGIHVEQFDSQTGQQFRIEAYGGHLGGSLDAQLYDAPDLPGLKILGEFKTYAEKYFNELKKKGVKVAQEGYYIQMQVYMHFRELPFGMHFAINKNNDELYIEIVQYDRYAALQYIERAGAIIQSDGPPARISESPGWYECQMCDMKPVCHFNEAKATNCRTCKNSKPLENGKWLCVLYNYELNVHEQRKGCQHYVPIQE